MKVVKARHGFKVMTYFWTSSLNLIDVEGQKKWRHRIEASVAAQRWDPV